MISQLPMEAIKGVVIISIFWSSATTIGALEYPCVGSTKVINMSQVCDGEGQCPLHDDEYYCKRFADFNNKDGVISTGWERGTREPCCKVFPCLTELGEDTNPSYHDPIFYLPPMNDRRLDIAANESCPWYQEHEEKLRCTDDISQCPRNCTCCPLVIYCVETSWSYLEYGFNHLKTSWVTVRILILANLKEPEKRNWTVIADSFPNLRHLDFSDTPLKRLHHSEFASFKNLDVLVLHRNNITSVEKDNFIGLTNLTWLTLEENNISHLEAETFIHVPNLLELSLFGNPFTRLANDTFLGLDQVYILRLTNTGITELRKGNLHGLSSLQTLPMHGVKELVSLEPGTFDDTPNLKYLELDDMNIQTLQLGTFDRLHEMCQLFLDGNIRRVETGVFRDLPSLEKLIFKGMENLEYNSDIFDGLDNEKVTVYADKQAVCCIVDATCSLIKTLSIQFTTCGDLLPDVLRVFIWLLGILAVLGNLIVIVKRHRKRNETSSMNVQRILILNLAMSDLLMGVYMLIIAGVDVYYGSSFFWYADNWRLDSNLCKFAGFLALLSSETSIFILTTISIDRFVRLVFPFSRRHFRGTALYVTLLLIWCSWILVSAVAQIDTSGALYGNSNVCIGLPLVLRDVDPSGSHHYGSTNDNSTLTPIKKGYVQYNTEKSPAWAFSIVIFLAINSICLIIVFACYLTIFIAVRSSRQSTTRDPNRGDEIKMAVKMGLIVGTDFCCWLPVILMGILSQAELAEIPIITYAWIIVFVLPLNSSLNPYIYTISGANNVRSKRRQQGSQLTFLSTRFSRLWSIKESDNGSYSLRRK